MTISDRQPHPAATAPGIAHLPPHKATAMLPIAAVAAASVLASVGVGAITYTLIEAVLPQTRTSPTDSTTAVQ